MDSEGVLLGEEVIRVMTNTTRMESSPVISDSQDVATCPGRNRLVYWWRTTSSHDEFDRAFSAREAGIGV
jgi:hypothetical protein